MDLPSSVCVLDERITKIFEKLNSHNGFKRAAKTAKKCCKMDWISGAILQVAQKAIMRFQFIAYFCNPLAHHVDLKNIVKCWKNFLDILLLQKHTVHSKDSLPRRSLVQSLENRLWRKISRIYSWSISCQIWVNILKVSKFQNEFMNSSFLLNKV